MNLLRTAAAIAFFSAAIPGLATASAPPLKVPFDFSRHALGLDVMVKGHPLHMILDTGVDPSVIDLARAEAIGLAVDRGTSGEASGEGDAASAKVFPAVIADLKMGGRDFGDVEALAFDMSGLSRHYGKPLDGVLGYSFLTGKIVLIDYPARTLTIFDRPSDAIAAVGGCSKHWSIALNSYPDDSIPIVPDFRFGTASGEISLDTGSNGGITLYQAALELPGLKAALAEKGKIVAAGARGEATSKTYVLHAPVGFGPFTLPAGQVVSLRAASDVSDARVANIGNKLFAALTPKMLLDYQSRRITFYAGCR